MAIGRREIILISVLAVVIYLFIGINFIWIDYINDIKGSLVEYGEVKLEKDSLSDDVTNISDLKAVLKDKEETINRANEYISESVNTIDGAEYINKYITLKGKNFSQLTINAPEILNVGEETEENKGRNANTAGDSGDSKLTYFDLSIDFDTELSFGEIEELVKLIEGGTKKVVVKEIDMVPVSELEETVSNKFAVKMKIAMFSTGEKITDLEEFERYKFGKFNEPSLNPYNPSDVEKVEEPTVPDENEESENNQDNQSENNQDNQNNQDTGNENTSNTNNASTEPETTADVALNNTISIIEEGYHTAGQNARFYGVDKKKTS